MFGLNFFWNVIPMPAPPKGSRVIPFFQATGSSGFMVFVKVCEITGAVLIAIPKTRNWGLLVLRPIVVNILAFNVFVMDGAVVLQSPVLIASVVAAYLLWSGREKFFTLPHS
jgi:putative oxidoreductase